MFFSKTSLVLALGLVGSLLPSMVSANGFDFDFLPNPDKACPSNQGIVLLGHKSNKHCGCVKYKDFYNGGKLTEKPLKDGCHAEVVKKWGVPRCKTHCPTKKPKTKKQRDQEPIRNPDGSIQVCAKPSVACPIAPQSGPSKTLDSIETECVFPEVDLDNCGGCTTLGQGQSCAAIDGVKSTSCVAGQCQVYSCQDGFKLISNPLAAHVKRSKVSRDAPVLPAKICVPA